MKKSLNHVFIVGLVMFALLFGSVSTVQFLAADSLRTNPMNNRTLLEQLSRPRGPILIDGEPVAKSVPVDTQYKYQRQYGGEGLPAEMYAGITGYYSVIGGSTGIERTEGSLLSGLDDRFFYDQISNWLTGQENMGAAIELTINPKAQKAAWDALGGQNGAAVALDPKTGHVLAMVSTPGWDPNPLASHDTKKAKSAYDKLLKADGQPAVNKAIGGKQYPPGSVFKLVTAAAALEHGDYTPDTELDSPTRLDLPQTSATIGNAGGAACGSGGKASFEHALAKSCNTTFAKLGMDIGEDAMAETASKFGFGESFESPIKVDASQFPEDLNPPQLAQSSIGQYEVRTTPMQMAMVAAAIANDGKEMRPNLVKQVKNARTLEVMETPRPKTFSKPMSKESAGYLNQMMQKVVTDGTGGAGAIPGVKVAAKTGTAQHAKGAAPHAWYTSFAPADDPQVAVAVVVENGGAAGSAASGGRTAGPIAKKIMEAVIS